MDKQHAGIAVIVVIVLAAFGAFMLPGSPNEAVNQDSGSGNGASNPGSGTGSDWRTIALRDVSSGTEFKVSDFEGKPVLLESFAVWCPTCKQQQDQIKLLHDQVGNDVISISIDTDPSEDEARVLEHVERNGYDWLYAIDRNGFAQSLVDEFGINVVNAASAPIILIDENGEARLLRFGVKGAEELRQEAGI